MSTLIFLTWAVLAFPAVIIFISIIQLYQSRKMLQKLEVYSPKKVKIRINQMLIFIGGAGGLSHKAVMYVSENFILITPKHHGYFNALFNFNLPVLVCKKESKIHDLKVSYNVIVPENFKISTWNSISFKYKYLFGKYSIQINLRNKEDASKTEILKNWC